MRRVFQIGGLLWLAAALSFAAAQKGGNPKPPRNTAPPAPKGAGAGVPKGGRANPPLRLQNPGSLAAQLYRMSPEQRERVLEKLPPARQEQARKTLEQFDKLPPEQKQQMIQRAERLASMPPEREREVVQSWQSFQKLPPERKQAIQQALRGLQSMSDEQRNQVMSGEPFKNRFSPDEQRMIRDISDIVMPPL